MKIKISLAVAVLTLTLNIAISAHAFQGGVPGGPGFTGAPGGGFTGPRGGGFTDSLGGMRGDDNSVGLNLLNLFRMRRSGGAQLSGNLNRRNTPNTANRPRAASNPNRANRDGIGWNNPHLRFHRDWVNGYWTGRYADGLGWRPVGHSYPGFEGAGVGSEPGYGVITGLGWGLSPWLYGPMLYQYEYSHYRNPYQQGTTTAGNSPGLYDYSQPIDAQSKLPPKLATDRAVSTFKSAREGFQRCDYEAALILVDNALKLTPYDPTMHEFRALTLFALGRCEEAAPALYAVLSIEPGWDWTTLISIYRDPARYTQQLRSVEAYSTQHPQSAPAHFVLAYHYLTQDFARAAIEQFKLAAALEPGDSLSPQLIQQLEHPPNQLADTVALAGSNQTIDGTWLARPDNDVSVRLTFQKEGRYTWDVSRQGKDRHFKGTTHESNGAAGFVQDGTNNTMVGSVRWTNQSHFVFRVMGAAPNDRGLSFTKDSDD